MATKNKIDFLNTVHKLVSDNEKMLQASCVVESSSYEDPNTTFIVDTVNKFEAGQSCYIDDGTSNAGFHTVVSVTVATKAIVFATDLTAINNGAVIRYTIASELILNALLVYSRIKRFRKVATISGSGTSLYSLPDDWAEEFSTIKQIEYPTGYVPPKYLADGSYYVYNVENVKKLKLDFTLASGRSAIMTYETVHSFGLESPYLITAPDNHFYAICWICGSQYLLALATAYGQSNDNMLEADSTNRISRVDEYRRLAKEFLGWGAGALSVSVKELEGQLSCKAYSITQRKDKYEQREKIFPNIN